MLKIFLTADNHIGLKYANHFSASKLINARISAFQGMVDAANSEGCELFVIAGDLFERPHSISKKDVAAIIDILSGFSGTVAVLPGNHDYYDSSVKVWEDFCGLIPSCGNILFMNEQKPYFLDVLDGVAALYPAPCGTFHSEPSKNGLDWIKKHSFSEACRYRIGIAHGSLDGETIDAEGVYFPMRRDELSEIPVDVWLLGHTHVPFPRGLSEELLPTDERIFNAGTHVQTDVSCNTEGLCFVICLDDKNVSAKKFRSGSIRFYRKDIALSAGEFEDILCRELSDIDDESVVDLQLSGSVTREEYENRAEILEKHLARFLEGTYSDASLSKLLTKETICSEFAETSFAAGFLNALSDPKELQLAYELIKSLREDKK